MLDNRGDDVRTVADEVDGSTPFAFLYHRDEGDVEVVVQRGEAPIPDPHLDLAATYLLALQDELNRTTDGWVSFHDLTEAVFKRAIDIVEERPQPVVTDPDEWVRPRDG